MKKGMNLEKRIKAKQDGVENHCLWCDLYYKKLDLLANMYRKLNNMDSTSKYSYLHEYNHFNDRFVIKNQDIYPKCLKSHDKEYCSKWLNEFHEHFGKKFDR